jgi:hypothetical protein
MNRGLTRLLLQAVQYQTSSSSLSLWEGINILDSASATWGQECPSASGLWREKELSVALLSLAIRVHHDFGQGLAYFFEAMLS